LNLQGRCELWYVFAWRRPRLTTSLLSQYGQRSARVSAGWLRYCQKRLKWRFGFIFLKVDFVGIELVVR
jgi:hypothetical protein